MIPQDQARHVVAHPRALLDAKLDLRHGDSI